MFRPLLWPTVASLLALALLLSLGTWQMQRWAWKNDLTARVKARVTAAPVPLPPQAEWPNMDLAANEYRPFSVRGTFDHEAEFHAFTSVDDPKGKRGGPGYWVLTPLALDGGGTVLINRGFVPPDAKDPGQRTAGAVQGEVEITGLLRLTVPPRYFVPEPDLAKNIWFSRDVDAMAASRNINDMSPFFIDAAQSAPGGLPQGGETRLVFRNNHLDYAMTWYGLALVLIGFYFAFHHQAGRLGRIRGQT